MRLEAGAAAPDSAAGDDKAASSNDMRARLAAPMEQPMMGAADSLWCSPAPMPAWLRDRLGGGPARPAGAGGGGGGGGWKPPPSPPPPPPPLAGW